MKKQVKSNRKKSNLLLINSGLIFLLLLLASFTSKNRPVHIFMAGDSTMANKVLYKYVTDLETGEQVPVAFPERGWGMLLSELFTDEVVIDNYAKNGRSTRTFIEEGLWNDLESNIQKGDYVIIQFGHNDASESKKDRYTPPADYKKNLVKFIDETRKKGGTPIICTPVARRKFENGKIVNTHGVYVDLVKEVAKEKKVLLIDLFTYTSEWLNKEGEDNSARFFMNLPAGTNKIYPDGLTDNTHFVEAGALTVAGFFNEEIEKQNITGLTQFLKKNEKPYVSQVWVSDLGNGRYKNPVLYADYSDPDVCRVGNDYYMTASSFNCIPGLPILHSNDLVNWKLIGHAVQRLQPDSIFSKMQHGNGIWAPAIRYHSGEFYIYYGDPDFGVYMTKTKNPAGEWEPLTLVKSGKGLIDACPFWDEDGQVYLAHAYAGSRAGIKSILSITHLSPDGKKAIGASKIIYNGHDIDETIEGPKLYKKNGYYYIFAPAGGVATGWQTVLRSKTIWGPYERKMVMAQGNSKVNGPHQGAWVNTETGEDWFLHFQDTGAFGRVVHLQPMKWVDNWPVIGEDKNGRGWGEPVIEYKKPNVGKTYPIITPVESDNFSKNRLGLQWQWHANPMDWWYFTDEEKDVLSLFSVPVHDSYKNLWDVPNLLLQKTPSNQFSATAKLTFIPNKRILGEKTGIVVMGLDYAALSMENTSQGFVLSQVECTNADKGNAEKINESAKLKDNTVYLRVRINSDTTCSFSYSTDGKAYKTLGNSFKIKEGKWIGAKIGMFCIRPEKNNDGGRVDVDWFRIEK